MPQMESYFLPDGGSYHHHHHHHSHFNGKKGTATCRILNLPGVTKAEEAAVTWTVGSTAQVHDHRAEMPPLAALQALLYSR